MEKHKNHQGVKDLQIRVAAARRRVLTHPVYASLNNHVAVQTFMEYHVFAVWDFMSLLKSLQRELTCISVPWIPTGPKGTRRLINDIVLVEESDQLNGGFFSHFELYVAAMIEAGADFGTVDRFIGQLAAGSLVVDALREAEVPGPSARFVRSTWELVEFAPLHCRAAAFAVGRQDLIPEMFTRVVEVNRATGGLNTFIDYLERHIEIDGDDHSPMAMRMLLELCGDNEVKWHEAALAAESALDARCLLWNGILTAITGKMTGHSSRWLGSEELSALR